MPSKTVRAAFRRNVVSLKITALVPSKKIDPRERHHTKQHSEILNELRGLVKSYRSGLSYTVGAGGG